PQEKIATVMLARLRLKSAAIESKSTSAHSRASGNPDGMRWHRDRQAGPRFRGDKRVWAAYAEFLGHSIHFNDLDPVGALSDRIAGRLAELPACLIDPIDREAIRFNAGGDEIMSARIDIDAARLPLGGKIGDVGELAGVRRYHKQCNLVSVALGRIEEFSVRR